MAIRRVMLLGLLLTAMLAIPHPLAGQPGRTYEEFAPTPQWYQIFNLLQLGQRQQALAQCLQLAADHPGSTLGARALLEGASIVRGEQARQLLQRVSAEYPQSQFDINARSLLLPQGDPKIALEGLDRLAQSFGGPPLADILRNPNPRSLVRQVQALPLEIQEGLLTLYLRMEFLLSGPYNLNDSQRGLTLALFNHKAFAFRGEDTFGRIEDALLRIKFGVVEGRELTRANPTVRIRTPRQGQQKGPRPKIQVELSTGPIDHAQVNLGKLKFTLDGVSLLPILSVGTKIDKKLKGNKPLEVVRLTARPSQPLAPGQHTLDLTASVNGYSGTGPGLTRLTWTFTVGRTKDDSDDENDDCDPEEDDDDDRKGGRKD